MTFKNHQISLKEDYNINIENNKLKITIGSKSYLVDKNTNLDVNQHKCDLICRNCETCVHAYYCDCEGRAIRSEFCVHLHIAIKFHKEHCKEIYDNEFDQIDNNFVNCNKNLPLSSTSDHHIILDELKRFQSPIKLDKIKSKALDKLNEFRKQLNYVENEINNENDPKEVERIEEKLNSFISSFNKKRVINLKFKHFKSLKRINLHQNRFFSTKKNSKKYSKRGNI
jgi:hypothetical protein